MAKAFRGNLVRPPLMAISNFFMPARLASGLGLTFLRALFQFLVNALPNHVGLVQKTLV